jgi:hypothetical protein
MIVLNEFLRLLNSGGLYAMDELARQLGVSQELVASMVDGLAQRGYLAGLDDACGTGGCTSCGLVGACHTAGAPRPRLLALTEKGRRAASALG